MNNFSMDPRNAGMLAALKKHWGLFLALGIGLVVVGSLAIYYAYISTLFSVLYLGFAIITVGIFEGIKANVVKAWNSFFLHLFLCVLYIVGGVFIVMYPAVNAITLTLLLAIFLIVAGILRTIFAITQHVPHKGWLILNGLLSVLLGVLIMMQWPSSGLWALGLLLGVDILFTGWTWIMLALTVKKVPSQHQL